MSERKSEGIELAVLGSKHALCIQVFVKNGKLFFAVSKGSEKEYLGSTSFDGEIRTIFDIQTGNGGSIEEFLWKNGKRVGEISISPKQIVLGLSELNTRVGLDCEGDIFSRIKILFQKAEQSRLKGAH